MRAVAGTIRPRWPFICCSALLLLILYAASHQSSAPSLAAASKYISSYLSSHLPSTPPYDPDDPLSYRHFLERTTSPLRQITHSPTLTFSRIYVLSLPWREDRRKQMRKLAKGLGVEITFVDAASKDESFIKWIGERVAETRVLRRELMAEARQVQPSAIGGLAIGSDWVTPTLDKAGLHPFPSFPPDARYPSGDWITHLEAYHSAGNHTTLTPTDPNFNITEALWDRRERKGVRQVHEAVISTFWGQTRALKEAIRNGDESALIMEDDVDVEWDIERLWSRIETKLPEGWDVTFLGHCWGHEILTPWYRHPFLHQSVAPMCLHGWAVSSAGARRIFSSLLSPWSAFSTAVDSAMPSLIHFHQINAFSVQPPLIIQRKDGPSDLQKGNGSKWRGFLSDSTVERIKMDEGVWEGDEVWDPDRLDPATEFREVIQCVE